MTVILCQNLMIIKAIWVVQAYLSNRFVLSPHHNFDHCLCRMSILTSAQMRLARLDELRLAAKAEAEMRLKRQRAELGTKVEMKVQQAEANRLLILGAYRQRRATLKERTSQSLQRRMARESKYKERVHATLCQKRAAAEKKRLSLLEAEKRRAHARAMQVQSVANSVSYHREIERNKMKSNLENRIQRVHSASFFSVLFLQKVQCILGLILLSLRFHHEQARRKRAEYLMQRGRQYTSVLSSWNMMHEHADNLSRKLARYCIVLISTDSHCTRAVIF